jgi:hypothetical protein
VCTPYKDIKVVKAARCNAVVLCDTGCDSSYDGALAMRLSQPGRAAAQPVEAWLHIDRDAEWAQPEHTLCCGMGESVPLVDAVPSLLLSIVSQAMRLLPLADWQSTCNKLEDSWARLARSASALAQTNKLPTWWGVASHSRHMGSESHHALLLNALMACGFVAHALAACMPAARRACCPAKPAEVRAHAFFFCEI